MLMSARVSWLEDANVIDSLEAASQLPHVEEVALVDRHGAPKRGVVDPGVAGEVDASDRMSRSRPDACRQVSRPAHTSGLHFGREIEAPSASALRRKSSRDAHNASTAEGP
jgi:hypothetical protein